MFWKVKGLAILAIAAAMGVAGAGTAFAEASGIARDGLILVQDDSDEDLRQRREERRLRREERRRQLEESRQEKRKLDREQLRERVEERRRERREAEGEQRRQRAEERRRERREAEREQRRQRAEERRREKREAERDQRRQRTEERRRERREAEREQRRQRAEERRREKREAQREQRRRERENGRGWEDREDDREGRDWDRADERRREQREAEREERRRERAEQRRRERRKIERAERRKDADERRERRRQRREFTRERLKDIARERRLRKENGRVIIEEPGKRRIIREGKRAFIEHDDTERLRDGGRDVRVVKGKRGRTRTIITRSNGVKIITIRNRKGRLLKRIKRLPNGRKIVLINNSHKKRRGRRFDDDGYRYNAPDFRVQLPDLILNQPRRDYYANTDRAGEDEIYETLSAPPIQKLEDDYTLDEIRYSPDIRKRLRKINLNTVTFASGSWEVRDEQIDQLEIVARVIKRIVKDDPEQIMLVAGHTDAIGSDEDNLSLSDRRAETVARILTDEFGVPPENLVTQGYGESDLLIDTQRDEVRNRRVEFMRITPFLAQN